jgi:hypothetical protein
VAEAITTDHAGTIPAAITTEQDTRADALAAKTMFATEMMRVHNMWTEKEVR